MDIRQKEFGNTGLSEYTVFISDPVERMFQDIFDEVIEDFRLPFGDMSPHEHEELEDLVYRTKRLLEKFVNNNLPPYEHRK